MISGMKENLPAYSSVRRFFYDYRTENFQPFKGTCGILHNNGNKLGLGDTVIHLSIIIIHGISVFLGGFLTGKMVKEQKYIWGLMLGVCYVLVIGIVSFIMNGTIHISAGGTLTNVILCLAAGMLGGMLG